MKETIKQLEKEIEKVEREKNRWLDLVKLLELKAKLQTLKDVCEEIEKRVLYLIKEKDKKGKKKVGDIVYLHIYDMINELKELLKKFQGEEE